MDKAFLEAYGRLKPKQKEAVDNFEGPMLVLAGPGTGKTQLLSVRVAKIIKDTDTSPNNILCLTFTDNAARNMRERLQTIIGQPAAHVSIHTFHSFGSEIITNNPDYFLGRKLSQQVDELGRYQILHELFDRLAHSNPLSTKIGDDYIFLSDTANEISYLKQNAITPKSLHHILLANNEFMSSLTEQLSKTFAPIPSGKLLDSYKQLLSETNKMVGDKGLYGFPSYAEVCARDLKEAIDGTKEDGRWAPLITAWRLQYCIKNDEGQHVFKDSGKNYRKMQAVANIYQEMIDKMSEAGLYDFDDMIVEVVQTLDKESELRLTLQEHYQYILVDEFQDTNKAQLKMLTLMADNPLFEGRPNVMVVGDDDQAIYAFQGAEVSNMVAFTSLYNDTKIISLRENFRSTSDILIVAKAMAQQISDRLDSILPISAKEITAEVDYKAKRLEHAVFSSELAQYDWIANSIGEYIKSGLDPKEIAVIAPRHRYLERLQSYLRELGIPMAYERRDDILNAPIIIELLTMTKLIVAIAANQQNMVDLYLSQVLSYEFFDIKPEVLINLSLQVYDHHSHWLTELIKSKSPQLKGIALWFSGLASESDREPLEYILDQLMGENASRDGYVSPMHSYHFNIKRYRDATSRYLDLLGQISTLRQKLRQWQPNNFLKAEDLVTFAELHERAKLKVIDENPHTQSTNAVQLMTAYKAKGLEFEVVFIINAQDEVWGPTARTRSSMITLPENLPIEPSGSDDNDKLRLLYVATTRAKHDLLVTSYTHNLDNKVSPGLSFIGGNSDSKQSINKQLQPKNYLKPTSVEAVKILATDWSDRFQQVIADKKQLFEPILKKYKLSVTHLNNFTDIVGAGPEYFLTHNLLRFPQAPSPSAAYGDAIHKSLQWTYTNLKNLGKLPTESSVEEYFLDVLVKKHLRPTDFTVLKERGIKTLHRYIPERGKDFNKNDLIERGFHNDGVTLGEARLSGKIDKIHIDGSKAYVVDFKTGKPSSSWQAKDAYEKVKLHKYAHQLMFYKILIEHSASFQKKLIVNSGALEYIEPNDNGKLVNNLELSIDPIALERFTKLIQAVWRNIEELKFPDTKDYKKDLSGVVAFEDYLISTLLK